MATCRDWGALLFCTFGAFFLGLALVGAYFTVKNEIQLSRRSRRRTRL